MSVNTRHCISYDTLCISYDTLCTSYQLLNTLWVNMRHRISCDTPCELIWDIVSAVKHSDALIWDIVSLSAVKHSVRWYETSYQLWNTIALCGLLGWYETSHQLWYTLWVDMRHHISCETLWCVDMRHRISSETLCGLIWSILSTVKHSVG